MAIKSTNGKFKITFIRAVAGVALFAACIFMLSYSAFASREVKVLVNGRELECSQNPIIKDGVTFVPMRDIFEGLGAKVEWDAENRSARALYNSSIVTVFPDRGTMDIAQDTVKLSPMPVIEGGRIMLPLRFVAESLDCSVIWDGESYTVSVSDGGVMKVGFLGCGQADAIFLELPDRTCMLIDAGESSFGEPLENFIVQKGYTHLDRVVATHPHSDHIGSMAHILKSFSVGSFYMPEVSHTTKTFENMLDALAVNGCKTEYISRGDVIRDGQYCIKVLSPEKQREYIKMNDYSAVLKMDFKGVSLLFSADAEAVAEESMVSSLLDLKADILKVGHHGSSTSSTENYLDAVSPDYAVITARKDDEKHPSKLVLSLLEKRDIKIYITGEQGAVTFITDGYIYVME